MKTKKLSFSEINGAMSRSEMKKIMAGSGNNCNDYCKKDSDCSAGVCKYCIAGGGSGGSTCGK